MNRTISPPPLKRRKVQTSLDVQELNGSQRPAIPGYLRPETDPTVTRTRCIRLFSWNINGIQPFLPAADAPITSFFKPVSQEGRAERVPRAPQGTHTPSGNLHGNPLRAFLQRHGWPEIVFLQELKMKPSDKKTPASLLRAINTSLGGEDASIPGSRYTLDVNLPRDKYNARGFGGRIYGVGTLIREDFASRYVANVRHAEWDLEGRITIVELGPGNAGTSVMDRASQPDTIANATDLMKLDAGRPLALLNIYAVNGTTAPYRSPETGQVAGTRHSHKLAFHRRLCDECRSLESRGFSVVLAGDMNVARGRLDGHPSLRTYPRQHCVNRADFNAKFFGDEDVARAEADTGRDPWAPLEDAGPGRFDGVDVFRALRGKERRYTYHPRHGDDWGSSCDRVDFIVVSKTLFDSGQVVETDILDSPQERGTSDHVPLWVKIRLGDQGSF